MATNSYEPRQSSGLSYVSILLPVWSKWAKYSAGTIMQSKLTSNSVKQVILTGVNLIDYQKLGYVAHFG